jgi:phage baseplate assembly protein W
MSFIFSVFGRQGALKNKLLETASIEEQVRQSLLFILSTDCGERPLFPEYGTNLRQYLFRRNTDSLLQEMSSHVQEKLTTLENRIAVEELKAERNPKEQNNIDLIIRYRILESDLKQTIRFPVGLVS